MSKSFDELYEESMRAEESVIQEETQQTTGMFDVLLGGGVLEEGMSQSDISKVGKAMKWNFENMFHMLDYMKSKKSWDVDFIKNEFTSQVGKIKDDMLSRRNTERGIENKAYTQEQADKSIAKYVGRLGKFSINHFEKLLTDYCNKNNIKRPKKKITKALENALDKVLVDPTTSPKGADKEIIEVIAEISIDMNYSDFAQIIRTKGLKGVLQEDIIQEGLQPLKFEIDNRGFITGFKGAIPRGDLIIPEKIDGKIINGFGANAFANEVISGELKLPKTIKKFGFSCFARCRIRGTLDLSHLNITEFGAESVFELNEFSLVILPKRMKRVESYSFMGSKMKQVKIGKKLEYIGKEAFASNKLRKVVLPRSVKEIDEEAFRLNDSILEVTIQSEVKLQPDSLIHIKRVIIVGDTKWVMKHPFLSKYYKGKIFLETDDSDGFQRLQPIEELLQDHTSRDDAMLEEGLDYFRQDGFEKRINKAMKKVNIKIFGDEYGSDAIMEYKANHSNEVTFSLNELYGHKFETTFTKLFEARFGSIKKWDEQFQMFAGRFPNKNGNADLKKMLENLFPKKAVIIESPSEKAIYVLMPKGTKKPKMLQENQDTYMDVLL